MGQDWVRIVPGLGQDWDKIEAVLNKICIKDGPRIGEVLGQDWVRMQPECLLSKKQQRSEEGQPKVGLD